MAFIVESKAIDDGAVLDQAKTRGCGLPSCGKGVTVPASQKPKPMRNKGPMTRPFLSNPAAMPSGIGKIQTPDGLLKTSIILAAARDKAPVPASASVSS